MLPVRPASKPKNTTKPGDFSKYGYGGGYQPGIERPSLASRLTAAAHGTL